MVTLVRHGKKVVLLIACLILLYSLTFASKQDYKGIDGVNEIKPKPSTIISASWGKKSGQFGKTDEANRPGPMSFSVFKNKIFFLDQENKRVQVFNTSGKYLDSFLLRKKTYIDIKTEGFYIFLLDAYADISIDIYSLDGNFIKSLPISKTDEPVTGFQVVNGSVLAEYGHKYSKVVAGIKGRNYMRASKGRMFSGRQGAKNKRVKAQFNNGVQLTEGNDNLKFKSPDLQAILDLLIDNQDTYVLFALAKKEKDFLKDNRLSLVKISNGETKWQMILPERYVTDHFRWVDVSGGKIFQMQTTERGVELIQWQ